MMPFCTRMLPSATWTASAPAIGTISRLNHTAYKLPVYASQGGLPHHHATLGSGCRHTWPGGDEYPPGSNEKFQRCSHLLPISRAWPGAPRVAFKKTLLGVLLLVAPKARCVRPVRGTRTGRKRRVQGGRRPALLILCLCPYHILYQLERNVV